MEIAEHVVTIFLIEHLELVRRTMHRALEREPDFQVVGEAGTLEDALVMFRHVHPRVAVLAADLPGKRPATVVQRLRAAAPTMQVIVLAGFPDGADLLRAVEAGARACLTYAATISELADAIRAVDVGEPVIDQPALVALFDQMASRALGSDDPAARLQRLTAQERRVLALLTQGASKDSIAAELRISPQTVRTHAQRLLSKLGVHSRLEAVAFVHRHQLLGELVGDEPRHGRAAGGSKQEASS
jgi:two-component system, NarL family, response regulator DevR